MKESLGGIQKLADTTPAAQRQIKPLTNGAPPQTDEMYVRRSRLFAAVRATRPDQITMLINYA